MNRRMGSITEGSGSTTENEFYDLFRSLFANTASKEAIAERANVSSGYIRQILTGKKPPPSADILKRILAALGDDAASISTDDLIRLADQVRSQRTRQYNRKNDTSSREGRRSGNTENRLSNVPIKADRKPLVRVNRLHSTYVPEQMELSDEKVNWDAALLENIKSRCKSKKIMAIVGEGGSGKTTLAIEVMTALQESFNAVVIVSLGDFFRDDNVKLSKDEEAALAARALALALHMPERFSDEVGDSKAKIKEVFKGIRSWLEDKKMLIVLDSCDFLISGCGELIDALRDNRQLNFLLTSRRPLPYSEDSHSLSGMNLQKMEELFRKRAPEAFDRSSREDRLQLYNQIPDRFASATLIAGLLTEEENCSFAQIVSNIEEGSDSEPNISRYASLSRVAAFAYEKLSPLHQDILQCVSVFVGSFNVETLWAIYTEVEPLPDHPQSSLNFQRYFDDLRRRGWIGRMKESNEAALPRYKLIDAFREWLNERNRDADTDPNQSVVDKRRGKYLEQHARYFLRQAENARPKDDVDMELLLKLEPERVNLRIARLWFHKKQEWYHMALFDLAMWRFWERRSALGYGQQCIKETIEKIENKLILPQSLDPFQIAELYRAAGQLALRLDQYIESGMYFDTAYNRSRQNGLAGRRGEAYALCGLAKIQYMINPTSSENHRDLAFARLEESYKLFEKNSHLYGLFETKLWMGRFRWGQSRLGEASVYLQESLEFAERLAQNRLLALNYSWLARVELTRDNFEEAIEYCKNGFKAEESAKDDACRASLYVNNGIALWGVGNKQEGKENIDEGIRLYSFVGESFWIGYAYEMMASLEEKDADNLRAKADKLYAEAKIFRERSSEIRDGLQVEPLPVEVQIQKYQ